MTLCAKEEVEKKVAFLYHKINDSEFYLAKEFISTKFDSSAFQKAVFQFSSVAFLVNSLTQKSDWGLRFSPTYISFFFLINKLKVLHLTSLAISDGVMNLFTNKVIEKLNF